jgi:hypothetical protein
VSDSLPVDPSEIMARLDRVQMDLRQWKEQYEPVALQEGLLLATKKLADPLPSDEQTPASPNFSELGTLGNLGNAFAREDYNSIWQGSSAITTADNMRKSDGQVRATLRLVKTPVLAARWYVAPGYVPPPAAGAPVPQDIVDRNQMIADFVDKNLFTWMTSSWPQMLSESLLMLDYGFYMFEKVFQEYNGQVIWKKFAPRHPLDVEKWEFDNFGGPKTVYFTNPGGGDAIPIDIWKLAVFTYDKEAGNMEGVSVLRAAYKHWFFKENLYKIDAIQKERHGIGVPYIVLPPNFDNEDKRLAIELGANLRTNENAFVVVPPGWEIGFLKVEGNLTDAMASADHHDLLIARNILGQFLNQSTSSSQSDMQDMFLKATRYIADTLRDIFNKHCIPQLVRWNFGEQDYYPELRVRRIGDTVDWRTISFAMRNFIGAGVIVPDDQLENWVRDEMDLPKPDKATQRLIVAPQQAGTIPDGTPDGRPGPGGPAADAAHQNNGLGGIVSPPRQSTAGNQRLMPGANAGNDGSGTGK